MAKLRGRQIGARRPAGTGVSADASPAHIREYSNMPHHQQVRIDRAYLEHHPQNFEIVGRLRGPAREELREDIKTNGLREPLHVWPTEGKLYVVSGNERLEIIRDELSEFDRKRHGLDAPPCLIVHFSSVAAARQHIIGANMGKRVRVRPVEHVRVLFPPDETPLLYADLRGNISTDTLIREVKVPWGTFTSEEALGIEALREAQRTLRASLQDLTGWSAAFTAKAIKAAMAELRPRDNRKRKGGLSAVEKRELNSIRSKVATLDEQLKSRRERLAKLNEEISAKNRERAKLVKRARGLGVEIG